MNRPVSPDRSAQYESLKIRLPLEITEITAQKKNPERVSLFHNGEFLFGIHQHTCLECSITKGSHLTRDLLTKVEALEGYHAVKNKAYDYLSRRDHATGELSAKLSKKGFSTEMIELVKEELSAKGYLNDQVFSEKYAEEKIVLNRWGRRKIEAELLKKGVAIHHIRNGLDTAFSGQQESEICLELIRKRKTHFLKEENPAKRKNKIFNYLSGKGFSTAPISGAIHQFEQEIDV
ncbi:MAG: regulatory protein RecX [Balneolaceae bacterium]|nr:MAG: regulatory protein RecX [Balneolaceae bacterium]